MSRAARAVVLRTLGASPAEVEELLARNDNPFTVPPGGTAGLPLADESFVAAWAEYVVDGGRRGVVAALRERLPQLCFPIGEGISETPAYRAATRRGAAPPEGVPPLAFRDPAGVRLFLHPTPAGTLPVLAFSDRDDFVAALRALARRNEPAPVPPAHGALMVAGYNNWNRVARLRAAFERGELEVPGALRWAEAFSVIRERRDAYQDAFVLLSPGPYSGVSAAAVGLDEDEWLRLSGTVRLEHECAHYFTRRVLHSMGPRLMDELMADWAGIAAAVGRFRADWFLRFLGLEHPERYRPGGRLEVYRGTPPLSEGAFRVLQVLVRRAAAAVQVVDPGGAAGASGAMARARMLLALAGFTLEELAADGADVRLQARLAALAPAAPPGSPTPSLV